MGSTAKTLRVLLFLTTVPAIFAFLFWAVENAPSESSASGSTRTGGIGSRSADAELPGVPHGGRDATAAVVTGEDDDTGGVVSSLMVEKVRVLLGLKSTETGALASGAGHMRYGFALAPAPAPAPDPARLLRRRPAAGYFHSSLPRPSRVPPVEDVEVRRSGSSKSGVRRVVVAVVVSVAAVLAIAAITVIMVCHRSRRMKTHIESKPPAAGGGRGIYNPEAMDKVSFDPCMELFYLDSFAPGLPETELYSRKQSRPADSWSPGKCETDSESCSAAEIEILPEERSPSSNDDDEESFHSFSLCNSHPSTPPSSGASEGDDPRTNPSESTPTPPAKSLAPRVTAVFAPPPPLKPHVSFLRFSRNRASASGGSSSSPLRNSAPMLSPAPHTLSDSSEVAPSEEVIPSHPSTMGSSPNTAAKKCPEEHEPSSPRRKEPPSPPLPPVGTVKVPQPPLPPVPPPFPPPPPPSFKRGGSPGQAPPPPPPPAATPVGKDGTPLPKLKPLHWDKVRAAPDRSMVWDKIRSSSFELDEEMIESLFGYNLGSSGRTEEARSKASSPSKHVLEPRRLQNFTILLKALNATSEQIRGALRQGSGLCAQQLEALVKMVPTKEEEEKLQGFEADVGELDPAERFVRDILSIPFCFARVEAMLYRETFEDEVAHLRKSFQMLEEACKELRSSRLFLRLLEAVLKTGNRMNVGTTRGGARAFKLDALLKLADVKGTDGKTTLLHFVVQEIVRSEGAASTAAEKTTEEGDEDQRATGLELVAGLSTELRHVRTTAGVDLDALAGSVTNLSAGLGKLRLLLQEHDSKAGLLHGGFVQSMRSFGDYAGRTIEELEEDERTVFRRVREITEYYHGQVGKEEKNPLGIFVIVRDFLGMLDRVCKELGSSSKGHYSPNRAVFFG